MLYELRRYDVLSRQFDPEPALDLSLCPRPGICPADAGFINQPDGASIYSWGYGCTNGPENSFLPAMSAKAPGRAWCGPGPPRAPEARPASSSN